jgi:two-component system sensor histidine kinase UhpB
MIQTFFKKFPVLELTALIITFLVLAGWHSKGGGALMSPVTAVFFLAAIASKLFFEYSEFNRGLLLPARIFAIATTLAGVFRLAGVAFNINRINEIFYVEYMGSDYSMVLISAFSFILLGIAFYMLTLHNAEKIFYPHLLALITLFIALLSMIAYFFTGKTFYGITIYRPMGIAASVNFLMLSISILMVNRKKGFMGHITGGYQGARIARLLIPLAVAVPVLLGFFQLETEKSDFYSNPYNIALITLARIVILVIFIWRTAVIINRSNKALLDEIELRKSNEEILRYRKALLEAQNEAIPDAMLVVDNNGKIISYNRHFTEMWGVPEEVIKNGNDSDLMGIVFPLLQDPDEFIKKVEYLNANPGKAAHDEFNFKDGRIIERFGNQVTSEDGTAYGRAWYFRDITKNRNYEKQIENFNKELEIKVTERTEELDKSEKRFRLLVENSMDIISLIDYDGRIIYISPSIERLTGYTEKEMIGQSGFDLIHADDIEGGKNFRMKLLDMPGMPASSTFRLKHKNGGYIWIEGTVTNMLQEENVNAFVLNYHDITERKNAEESLRNSERHFRSLLENAHDLITLSDGKGKVFYVSPSIERITGHTIEETINNSVFQFVHPDEIQYGEKIRQEFLKRPGESIYISFRFRHKNGNYIWMEGTVINLLNDENVRAVVGNFHDVTEKKISEEKIRASNERFEMVSKATNDAVWDWDLETDRIYWNDEIKSMFDYCAEDIANGSEWKVHIHPEDFKRVIRKMLYHVKYKIQNWQDEYRFRCSDGSYKFVFNRGFILFNSDGKPYRIIGAMQDVTEINKLQQSLNNERIKKQKELTNATIEGQEKERAQIGKELHDNVNQLLTGTKLYLDVAASQPAMKDEMIKRSSENLTICMEEIRRLSSALVPPSTGITSFEDIVQDLLEPIRLATDINIEYDVIDVNTNVLTGEQQLNVYRIIQEHLNNIVKHSGAKDVLMSVKRRNNVIEVEIKDDGKGFNVAARRKGIGFKNIQSRAELLNGKMEVISTPGKGCMLLVSFPLDVPGTAADGIY